MTKAFRVDEFARGLYFENVAHLYDKVRPDYPDALFDDLLAYTGKPPTARTLEIGCATGQATLSLVRRGIAITCIEPGPKLAALARKNLASFPHAEIVCSRFENWRPPRDLYDMVVSANAIHWVKRRVRVRKPARVLRENGVLALFRSLPVRAESQLTPFIESALGQPILNPDAPQKVPREDEFRNSGYFGDFQVRRYETVQRYDAESFVALLTTLNRFKSMPPHERDERFRAIHELISKDGGRVTLKYETRLLLARRCGKRSWLTALRSSLINR